MNRKKAHEYDGRIIRSCGVAYCAATVVQILASVTNQWEAWFFIYCMSAVACVGTSGGSEELRASNKWVTALGWGTFAAWSNLFVWRDVVTGPPVLGSEARTLVVGWPIHAIERVAKHMPHGPVISEPRKFGFEQLFLWDEEFLVFVANTIVWMTIGAVVGHWIPKKWSRAAMTTGVLMGVAATVCGSMFLYNNWPAGAF